MPPKSKPSIHDVADHVGVSIMSVSRAIRGVEGVSESMRERILQAAEELGYRPNYNARSLAAAKSRLIGVSIPTLFDEVFADVLTNTRYALERSGFDLIVETSSYDKEKETAWVERILKWSPAGLILTGIDHTPQTIKRVLEAAIPIVEIWDYTESPMDVCVGIDHYEVGQIAADHLLEAGYKSACLVGIAENRDPRAEKRFNGFWNTFSKAGRVGNHRVDAEPSFEAGHNAVTSLFENGPSEFDCLFFLNDHLAFGGVCACEALNIAIPERVGIVGFNNLGINNVLNRKITTIATDRVALGEMAAQRLLARINGAKTPPTTRVPVRLRVGDTTRDIAATAGLPSSPLTLEPLNGVSQ